MIQNNQHIKASDKSYCEATILILFNLEFPNLIYCGVFYSRYMYNIFWNYSYLNPLWEAQLHKNTEQIHSFVYLMAFKQES